MRWTSQWSGGCTGAWVALVRGVALAYQRHRINLLAAGVAYWALLSLLPLITLTVSIAGFVLQDEGLRGSFVNWLAGEIPFTLSQADRESLSDTIKSASDFSSAGAIVALLVLAWSASSIFTALRNALNTVFEARSRGVIRGKALDFLMLPTLGLLFLLSIAATALIQIAQDVTADVLGGADPGANAFFLVASHGAALLVTVTTVWLVFRMVPNHGAGWRPLLVPAIVTGIFLEAAKVLVTLYLIRVSGEGLYASLGSVFAFLVWAYVSAIILLMGAAAAVEMELLHGQGRSLTPSAARVLLRPLRRLLQLGSA